MLAQPLTPPAPVQGNAQDGVEDGEKRPMLQAEQRQQQQRQQQQQQQQQQQLLPQQSGSGLRLYPGEQQYLSDYWREKYERDAKKYWDIFYKRNKEKFFKDRHYLYQEWRQYLVGDEEEESDEPPVGRPQQRQQQQEEQEEEEEKGVLSTFGESKPRRFLLELGCGAGNAVYPLLGGNRSLFVHACDFSTRAVDLVKAHPQYGEGRVNAFVADITSDDLTSSVPASSVHVATMIFVLSAISPEAMPRAVANVAHTLRVGGYVLFRDYAAGDLAQERLMSKEEQKAISPNFFVRGDGTRVFYYTEEFLRELFTSCGFTCIDMRIAAKVVENRAKALEMNRRWIQAVFQWKADEGACTEPTSVSSSEANANPSSFKAGNQPPVAGQTSPSTAQLQEGAPGQLDCSEGPSQRVHSREKEGEDGVEAGPSVSQEKAGRESTAAVARKAPADALDGVCDSDGSAMLGMFGVSTQPELQQVTIGDISLTVKTHPRESQHTQPHTGLLLWDSSTVLASFLLAHPHLTAGKAVLELGCGCLALPSLAACLSSSASPPPRVVVATDGEPAALNLLQENVERLDGREDLGEGLRRMRRALLRWGDEGDMASVGDLSLSVGSGVWDVLADDAKRWDIGQHPPAIARRCSEGGGFDVVLGADVVYRAAAVPALFATARCMMRPTPPGSSDPSELPIMLLCHVTRHVMEGDIVAAAEAEGFQLLQARGLVAATAGSLNTGVSDNCQCSEGKQVRDAFSAEKDKSRGSPAAKADEGVPMTNGATVCNQDIVRECDPKSADLIATLNSFSSIAGSTPLRLLCFQHGV